MADGSRYDHDLLIVGAGGGGKGGSSQSRTPTEAPNTLQSRQYASLIDIWGEGPMRGLVNGHKSIFFDGTPLQNADGSYNFASVLIETREGWPGQHPLAHFAGTESEVAVNTRVYKDKPIVRTITNPDCTAARVTIAVPGLSQQNMQNGDLLGAQVHFYIEVQSNGTGFRTVASDGIIGKTMSRYQRAYRFSLPAGGAPWDIRVTRASDDPPQTTIKNETWWDSYTEIVEDPLTYPRTAYIGLRMDAEQFSSIPARTYEIDGLYVPVPSNYDTATRTYTGSWDGTFKFDWTNNPAWVFYDLPTHPRYGLGQYLSGESLDKWSLYDIGRYCDEFVDDGQGGREPRFTCNVVIAAQAQAYNVLQNLASVFRGMLYATAGMLMAVADKPADPIGLLTNANVINGTFTYQGSDERQRHTVAVVAYNDPQNFGQMRQVYVEDPAGIARYGIRKTEVLAFGCTSAGQATRFGRWLLYTERSETEMLACSVGLAQAWLYPGAVIQVADVTRAGERTGGRVVSATRTDITLDNPAVIRAGYTTMISVVANEGRIYTWQVLNEAGEHRVLRIAGADVDIPRNAVYVVASGALAPTTWRVLSVEEGDKGTLTISALEHNPYKYIEVEQGIVIEPPNTSIWTGAPRPVLNVAVGERLYTTAANSIGVKAVLSWESNEAAYLVRWQRIGDIWFSRDEVMTATEIEVSEGETYTFSVTAVNALGVRSPEVSVAYVVRGKTSPPADVKNVRCTVRSDGIFITWDSVLDLDLNDYEVRWGNDWDTADVLGRAKVNYLLAPPMRAGTHTFLVRARDYQPVYSEHDGVGTATVVRPKAPAMNGGLDGPNVALAWDDATTSHAIQCYTLRYGPDVASAVPIMDADTRSFIERALWGGERVFWLTATDSAGNEGPASTTAIYIETPSVPPVSPQVIDNNVLLRWGSLYQESQRARAQRGRRAVFVGKRMAVELDAAQGQLPIDFYVLASARLDDYPDAGFAEATELGRYSGEFVVLYEQRDGFYRYFVMPVDTGGNAGPPGTVDIHVDAPPDFELADDFISSMDEADAWTNAARVSSGWLAAFESDQSWREHFVRNGWDTPQDQVDAGNPIYAQPGEKSAVYAALIDYGTALPAFRFAADLSWRTLAGRMTVTPTVATKADEADAWQVFENQSALMIPEGTRYIELTFEFTADDDAGTAMALASRYHCTLSTKNKTDQGEALVTPGGTRIPFNIGFLDVRSIVATPKSSGKFYGVVDFADEPNPTHFTAFIFNDQGVDVGGPLYWTVRGV